MRIPVAAVLVLLAACSGKKREQQPDQAPAPVGTIVHTDGGVSGVITTVDPGGAMHMDEDVTAHNIQPQPQPNRPGHPIDVTLRSTPPGAQVAVDGTVIGTTPAYWAGTADGHEHEFVFTMRGFAIARYRFVPVASGVIHCHLDPIREETDAGVPAPPPEVMSQHPPGPPTVNPPSPPTLPDAAPTMVGSGSAGSGPAGSAGSAAGSAAPPVGPQP